jgi:hypothetical protein
MSRNLSSLPQSQARAYIKQVMDLMDVAAAAWIPGVLIREELKDQDIAFILEEAEAEECA